jgi:hypothetical protein
LRHAGWEMSLSRAKQSPRWAAHAIPTRGKLGRDLDQLISGPNKKCARNFENWSDWAGKKIRHVRQEFEFVSEGDVSALGGNNCPSFPKSDFDKLSHASCRTGSYGLSLCSIFSIASTGSKIEIVRTRLPQPCANNGIAMEIHLVPISCEGPASPKSPSSTRVVERSHVGGAAASDPRSRHVAAPAGRF